LAHFVTSAVDCHRQIDYRVRDVLPLSRILRPRQANPRTSWFFFTAG
jgi:hypothetical protein